MCLGGHLSLPAGELTYVACDTNDGGVAGRDLTPFLRGWADTTREPIFGLYGSTELWVSSAAGATVDYLALTEALDRASDVAGPAR
jgi:hypothetical protein